MNKCTRLARYVRFAAAEDNPRSQWAAMWEVLDRLGDDDHPAIVEARDLLSLAKASHLSLTRDQLQAVCAGAAAILEAPELREQLRDLRGAITEPGKEES